MEDTLKLMREAFKESMNAYWFENKVYDVGDVIADTDDYKVVVTKSDGKGNIEAKVITYVTKVSIEGSYDLSE